MFNGLRTGAGTLLALNLPFNFTDQDVVSDKSKTESFQQRPDNLESGKDRLYAMFSVDEFGSMSSEITRIYQTAFMGFLTGAVYGGFIQSRVAYLDSMENNQATTFKSSKSYLDAKKNLRDQVPVNFAKGALKWGWRLSLFTTTYFGIVTTVAVYRGKSSIFEYITAGAVAGSMYKINSGLRGMAVGGLLGVGLGGVAGIVSLLLLKSTGMSMEEVRYWQHNWKRDRDQAITAAELKNSISEKALLLAARDENPAVRKHSLEDIPLESGAKNDKK